MAECAVRLFSHNFEITKLTPRARSAVTHFARRFIEQKQVKKKPSWYGQNNQTNKDDCVYATATDDRSEYRFHVNQLAEFKDHLKVCGLDFDRDVKFSVEPLNEPRKVELRVQSGWVPDPDYKQPEAISFLTDRSIPRKLLGMPPGYGKSYSTMQAIANLGELSVWSVQAKYVEKTHRDLLRTYDMAVEDVLVISKTKDLKMLLFMAPNALPDVKVILISSKLLQIWFSLYKKLGAGIEVIGYSSAPQYFYQLLGAGVRVIDEVHQEFHFNFLQDLYTHVPLSISLSATMQFDNVTRNRMAQLTYPKADRFEVDYVPYISATSVSFEFEKPDRIKVMGKQGTYSHHVFEDSVMKDKKVLGHYLDMIDLVVRKELLTDHLEGERMIIYAAGVEFCTVLRDDLRKRHPELKITRYCGSANDEYENLLTSDICVTTLGSAGTNVDIPNLKCALLTTAVDSSQSNIQGAGRLRDKLAPGRVPRFVWLVAQQFARPLAYHEKKVELLRTRAKILNSQFYGVLL